MMTKRKKILLAQSVIEYAITVAVVVGALLAIQVYFKRGVQGRLRDNVDNIGKQYDPTNVSSSVNMNISTVVTNNSTSSEEGDKIRTVTDSTTDSTQTLSGSENVGAF